MHYSGKYNSWFRGCLYFSCIIIGIVTLATVLCLCVKGINVNCKDNILPEGKSIFLSKPNSSSVSVNIPPNASITKIYASFIELPDSELDNAVIEVVDTEIGLEVFQVTVVKNLNHSTGYYETTFEKPIKVGSQGGEVSLFPGNGNTSRIAAVNELSVLYFENNSN